MHEPGLYATIADRDAACLVKLAAAVGVAMSLRDSIPADGGQVSTVAADPDGAGLIYRLGDLFILVVAINADADAAPGPAWAALRRRWRELCPTGGGVAALVTGDTPDGLASQPCDWGWVDGELDDVVAVARPEGEAAAHRFLSGDWAVAVALADGAERVLCEASDAAARLARRADDEREVANAADSLRAIAGNLGRLAATSTSDAGRLLFAPTQRRWASERGRLNAAQKGPNNAHRPADDYPYPLAAPLRETDRSWPPLRRFEKALDAAEAAVQVGAILVAASLRRAGESIVHPAWARPQSSIWPELALDLLGERRLRTRLCDPGLWTRVHKAYEPIVRIRNSQKGHGPTRREEQDGHYSELADTIEDHLARVLHELVELTTVELAVVRGIERPRARPNVLRLGWMSGSNPYFIESAVACPDHRDIRDLDIVEVDDGVVSSLFPLMMLIPAAPPTVGLLSGIAGGRARFLCRASGEEAFERLGPEAIALLLPLENNRIAVGGEGRPATRPDRGAKGGRGRSGNGPSRKP